MSDSQVFDEDGRVKLSVFGLEPSQVYKVVLTGGPCAGKTTAMKKLKDHFQAEGFRVYNVPEMATLLFTGGVERTDLQTPAKEYHFQETLIKMLLSAEEAYVRMARDCGKKAIVFCDRGTLDATAYIDRAVWQAILDENGWNNVTLRDKRYECVVHMVTAAIGAPNHYNMDNLARCETPAEATQMDERLRQSWLGHPYLVVVDNSTGFDEKLARVVDVVQNRIDGRAETDFIKRKFLLKKHPHRHEIPCAIEEFFVEYNYLQTPDGTHAALRKRGQEGSYTYTLIVRRGHEVETRRELTGREYVELLAMTDKEKQPVRQKRRYLLWDHKSFHIDYFQEPERCNGIVFLQVYMRGHKDAPVNEVVPPFFEVDKEVTGQHNFSLHYYATAHQPPNSPSCDDLAIHYDP